MKSSDGDTGGASGSQRVAIQGEPGSNSHRAALAFAAAGALGSSCAVKIAPNVFSDEVIAQLTAGTADWAVLPIENTLHGAVAEHYDLLFAAEVHIVCELSLPIHHDLLAPPGVRVRDVRRVFSHPVALSQCRRWFRAHPELEAIPYPDTAGAVRHVVEAGLKDAAALAPTAAAVLYGAQILAPAVEDDAANFTRFLLLRRGCFLPGESVSGTATRLTAGLRLRDDGAPGALGDVLALLADFGVDVTRIESRPIAGLPWAYTFFVEGARGAPAQAAFATGALQEALRADCLEARLLGVYPRAEAAATS